MVSELPHIYERHVRIKLKNKNFLRNPWSQPQESVMHLH